MWRLFYSIIFVACCNITTASETSESLADSLSLVGAAISEISSANEINLKSNHYELFEEPRNAINSLLPSVLQLKETLGPEVLEEYLVYYLVLNIRSGGNWADSYSAALPFSEDLKSARVYYLLSLASFKDTEVNRNGSDYSDSLELVNRSLLLNPRMPEALWLRSQIFAIQGGQLDRVVEDQKAVRDNLERLDPLLFLNNHEIINLVIRAVSD